MLLLDGAGPATATFYSAGDPTTVSTSSATTAIPAVSTPAVPFATTPSDSATAALTDTSLTTATFTASPLAAVASPPSSVALLKHLQLRYGRGYQRPPEHRARGHMQRRRGGRPQPARTDLPLWHRLRGLWSSYHVL